MVDAQKRMRQGKKRVMTKTRIDEISAVDFPAMEGARAVLVKRREGVPLEGDDADASKCGGDRAPITVVTSEEDGHAHLLRIWGAERGGETSFSRAPNTVEETDHAHPWSMDADGRITIGSNDGHTHTVDQRALVQAILSLMKRAAKTGEPFPQLDPDLLDLVKAGDQDEDLSMTTKTATTEPTEVEKLRAELDQTKKLLELTDAQRAHLAKLAEPARAAFLAKSATERQAEVDAETRKAADADPVEYTSPVTKRVYRRSAGVDVIELAKRADESEARAQKAADDAANERCEKRAAAELPRYPGELKVRAAIVKALEGIADEPTRKAAFEAIAAGNTALSGTFEKRGVLGGAQPADRASAVAKLDELAKARQREKGGDYYEHYDAVKDANPDLYRVAVGAA